MALENLKDNIKIEKEIVREIFIFLSQLKNIEKFTGERQVDKEILKKTIKSLIEQLRIINNSNYLIVQSISPFPVIGEKPVKTEFAEIRQVRKEGIFEEGIRVTIKKSDRNKFLNELNLTNEALKRIKKQKKPTEKIEIFEFKKSSFIGKVANTLFFGLSDYLIQKGHFKKLELNLRKANLPYLLVTYISLTFLFTLLAILVAIAYFVFSFFYAINLEFPFLHIVEIIELTSVAKNFLITVLIPLFTFLSFYFYPFAEKKAIEKNINEELPFVTLHMSAVATSGIEPTQIFKIVAFSSEYKNINKEMKKVITQVNLYGYDLTTALRNIAKETSSRKLSELLNGISTTISSGGSLEEFFNKRAETLLFDYKLEKEKDTKSAETFMDIYISIVIAAPMIISLLLVLMNISQINIGLSLDALAIVIVLLVSLINFIFIIILQLKRTTY